MSELMDAGSLSLKDATIRKIELKLHEYHVGHLFDAGSLDNAEFKVSEYRGIPYTMMIAMNRTVWGRTGGTVDVEYPANWWQHVKQRFYPSWAVKLRRTRPGPGAGLMRYA